MGSLVGVDRVVLADDDGMGDPQAEWAAMIFCVSGMALATGVDLRFCCKLEVTRFDRSVFTDLFPSRFSNQEGVSSVAE